MSDSLPLRDDRFERIRNLYWVAARRSENEPPYPWMWVFSPNVKPRQMMNPNMHWRRPTYAEAVTRQRWFDDADRQIEKWIDEWIGSRKRRETGVRTGLNDLPAVERKEISDG